MEHGVSFALEPLIVACQLTAGRALDWSQPPPLEALLHDFYSVPAPHTHGETLVALAILSKFTGCLGQHLHSAFHRRFDNGQADCFFSWDNLDVATEAAEELPLVIRLRRWSKAYEEAFDRAHARIDYCVRRYIDHHFRSPLSVELLAVKFGLEKRTLQRSFLANAGVSVKEYHVRVRVAHALTLLKKGDKVEAVALEVGWKSKKDLYHAMARLLGLSPGAIRILSDGSVSRLATALRTGTECCAEIKMYPSL